MNDKSFNSQQLRSLQKNATDVFGEIIDSIKSVRNACTTIGDVMGTGEKGLSTRWFNVSDTITNPITTLNEAFTYISDTLNDYVEKTEANEQKASIDLESIDSEIEALGKQADQINGIGKGTGVAVASDSIQKREVINDAHGVKVKKLQGIDGDAYYPAKNALDGSDVKSLNSASKYSIVGHNAATNKGIKDVEAAPPSNVKVGTLKNTPNTKLVGHGYVAEEIKTIPPRNSKEIGMVSGKAIANNASVDNFVQDTKLVGHGFKVNEVKTIAPKAPKNVKVGTLHGISGSAISGGTGKAKTELVGSTFVAQKVQNIPSATPKNVKVGTLHGISGSAITGSTGKAKTGLIGSTFVAQKVQDLPSASKNIKVGSLQSGVSGHAIVSEFKKNPNI